VKKEVRNLGEQSVVRHLNSSRGNRNGRMKGKANVNIKKNMKEIGF
jgi:hypothetical protein